MKTIRDKMITENIKISECNPGDELTIPYGAFKGKPHGCSRLTLVKIKQVGKDCVQIKYRGRWHSDVKIHKQNLLACTVVERTRKWVRSDGAETGFYPPNTQEIDGLRYFVPDDFDPNNVNALRESNEVAHKETVSAPIDLSADPDLMVLGENSIIGQVFAEILRREPILGMYTSLIPAGSRTPSSPEELVNLVGQIPPSVHQIVDQVNKGYHPGTVDVFAAPGSGNFIPDFLWKERTIGPNPFIDHKPNPSDVIINLEMEPNAVTDREKRIGRRGLLESDNE